MAARLLMITVQEFKRLVAKGHIAKFVKDRYRTVEAVQGYVRYLKASHTEAGKTVAEAARHIDMGTRRFYELLDDGVMTPAQGYDLEQVRRTYIRRLRKVAAGRGADPALDLGIERARTGFDIDGFEIKVRQDLGAKAIDYRGLYKNPGA